MNPEALAALLRAQNRILALRMNHEPGPRPRSWFVRILGRIANFSV